MKKILLFIAMAVLSTSPSKAQKSSPLANLLWEEVGGRIDVHEDHGGRYEIIDAAKSGYLKIAFTEEGCGCYKETTVGAYKDAKGNYTTLKMEYDGCGWLKVFSSNKNLEKMLPDGFGLHSFTSKSDSLRNAQLSALYYTNIEIPEKGTDTKISIAPIPFGIRQKGDSWVLSFKGYKLLDSLNTQNQFRGGLKMMFRNITNDETLNHIGSGEFDKIAVNDQKIVDNLFGEGKMYKSYKTAQALILSLEGYYKLFKAIEYNSLILGWNRNEGRFYIKKKIKNDAPELSFLEFVRQLPFLIALC